VKIAGRWAFQYTALDDCTRFRVLRLYRRLHQRSSLRSCRAPARASLRIRKLQCDNGREFPLDFVLAVQAAGIRHRFIRPRRPQQNGKVERTIASTRKSSGEPSVTDFDEAPRPFGHGREPTTTSDSPWRCRGGRQPKSLLVSAGFRRVIALCYRPLIETRGRVNLDETRPVRT